MSTRMLIDARHPEETRVAVVKGNRVEDFDYESVARHYHKGNIYLAKVTRVEPSLQACFVDYGENRHGFLAFSEIHPDYYQIPSEDREALLAEEAEHHKSDTAQPPSRSENDTEESASGDNADDNDHDDDDSGVEHISGEDDYDDVSRRKSSNLRRRYKIQEVIKRRQILLIQVVKEERGTKGAALTTYMSLAGRYCVLMPNSQNGGGISRKISNVADRKKLKDVMSALDVPEGMGCIIRTAGLNRTKTEIKRDFDYLVRLWDGIRERTLESVAPALIHEEADLIKRSIRDLYSRDIDEIHVEGDEGYRTAKNFMKLLMPSHARRVQHYKDRIPLFYRYQVENQLDAMYSPTVQLKSGGYLVIDPTEALIAIDVNSGRSTKEHNIEETALKTNLEASDEVARQLRLRDLAGLVVIDFIDMEDRGNNRAVEKRLKEALKSDRARIQVGRISSFGLLEMSRQRLRPNLLEATRLPCPHCSGAGIVPSKESATLNILRALEEEGIRDRSSEVTIRAPSHVAFYLLNQKRDVITELEKRYAFDVSINAGENLGSTPFEMDRTTKTAEQRASEVRENGALVASASPLPSEQAIPDDLDNDSDDDAQDDSHEAVSHESPSPEDASQDEQAPRKRRRRRRRGRRGRGGEDYAQHANDDQPASDTDGLSDAVTAENDSVGAQSETSDPSDDHAETGKDDQRPRRRPRRRKPSQASASAATDENGPEIDAASAPQPDIPDVAAAPRAVPDAAADEKSDTAPPRRRRVRRKVHTDNGEAADQATPGKTGSAEASEPIKQDKPQVRVDTADADKTDVKKPARPRRRKKPVEAEKTAQPANDMAKASEEKAAKPVAPASSGSAKDKVSDANTDKTAASRTQPAESSVSVTAPARTASVERHVITPNGAAANGGPKESGSSGKSDTEPRKRGWWQRALGR